jgi:plasmid stabilization system protein ParE
MIDMLNRAADILRSEGWEQEAAVVSKAADEIDRLRAELRRIAHAPHGKMYCADGHEEAVLIARAALEGEKTDV